MEINIIPKFLDNALSPVAKEAGEALSDIINLARSPLLKARKIRDLKLTVFLDELEKELRKIPEDKIVEPKLSFIGPALEDLFKYYFDEEHIVYAYKKIIAALMNNEKKDLIHPQFPFMLKQMTALEYEILKFMHSKCGIIYCANHWIHYNARQKHTDFASIIVYYSNRAALLESDNSHSFLNENNRINSALFNLTNIGMTLRFTGEQAEQYDIGKNNIINSYWDELLQRFPGIFQEDKKYDSFLNRYVLSGYGEIIGKILYD